MTDDVPDLRAPPERDRSAAEDVRDQLERILGHRDFEATDRTRDFLRFVVEETLAGRAHRLKGYTIALEVFGRPAGFDANLDPIVRIQAGRLRRALEHYYLVAGGTDPIRIDVPKGQYVPTFTRVGEVATQGPDEHGTAAWPPTSIGPSIGILPFANLSDDHGQDFFCSGLLEELLTELNRYEDIVCVPCRDATQAAGARFVVGGSVRRDRGSIKVSAHLTEVGAGQQIWSDSFKVPLEAAHLIEAQESIAHAIVSTVADEYGIVARRLSQEAAHKAPATLSAYEALLRYHHYMLVMTPAAAVEAFDALTAATERDPAYGPAWAGLANLYCHAVVFDRLDIDAPLDLAETHARRAGALTPRSQFVRTIIAYVHLLRGERDLFRREVEIALSLNPHSPTYTGTIGYLFVIGGEAERGRVMLESAIACNPCHPQWFHHGLYHYHFGTRNYGRAYEEALQVGHPIGFWDPCLRAGALGKLGRVDEAREAGRELLRTKPDIEQRIRLLLAYSFTRPDVIDDFVDGLRIAGLQID